MTTKTLMLAALAATLVSVPAFAQSYMSREQEERAITRDLNNQQADQPTQYYMPPPTYSYAPPPQVSYAPAPLYPQYSYAPPPAYSYSYDYPPRPFYPRY